MSNQLKCMNKIRWGAIQPLTGGMYIGAEQAIGNKAEWIISFPGFCDCKLDESGNIVDANNEYNLVKYLEKHDKLPPYYTFNRKPFNTNYTIENIEIKDKDGNVVNPDYNDIDIVVSVPVCSGLSMLTSNASEDTKEEKNSNMIWLAKYTLNVIQPKIYVFENAPTLLGPRGIGIRNTLEKMANDSGYSVVYYKTNTMLHDNCQHRIRTFTYFIKGYGVPIMNFEDMNVSVKEFFDRIPNNLTQQVTCDSIYGRTYNDSIFEFTMKEYGDNYKEKITGSLVHQIYKDKKYNELLEYIKNDDSISEKERSAGIKYINHAIDKLSKGMNFYCNNYCVPPKDFMPSIMFRTIRSTLHPFENRLLNIRECMTLMGLPYDFEMYGELKNYYPKIGQNVPVRTVYWIIKEAIRILNNDCEFDRNTNVGVFNNISKKREK